jgi:hypothetical protein
LYRGTHCNIYVCVYNVLIRFTLHHSPLSYCPLSQNNCNRYHCSTFTHIYNVPGPYLLPLQPLCLSPSPTGTHPWTGLVLPSCLSLFKVYFDCSRRGSPGISHMHMLYYSQISPLYYSFSIAQLPYYSTAFSAFCYTTFITDAMCFSINSFSITLFSSLISKCPQTGLLL